MFTYYRINRIQREEEEEDNRIMSVRRSEDIIARRQGETSLGLEKDQIFLKDRNKGGKARYGPR